MANEDKRKHIALQPKTAEKYKLIAKLKGMTHDGLANYLMNKEMEKK